MKKGFLAVIGATVAVAVAVVLTQPPPEPLKSPFPRADLMAAAPMALTTKVPCLQPPPAVRDILTVSKFGEDRRAHGSTVVDPTASEQYAANTRVLVEYARHVADLTNGFSKFNTAGVRDARCAMSWLNEWAEQDGMLGKVNDAGEPVRKWELASLSAAYLKIRSAPNEPEQSARVRRWLGRVAEEVRDDYSRNLKADSRSNNHLNWAAWAVMAAAIASDDRDLFAWSIDRFRFALAQIDSDGTLPLELKRRQLAFAYHNYALGPLIMLREGALANGVRLTREEEQKLNKLVDVVISGMDDPAFLSHKSGFQQDLGEMSTQSLAWLEPFYARTRDPRAARLLARYRPLSYTRLGGNLTELFGDYDPAAARAEARKSSSKAAQPSQAGQPSQEPPVAKP